MIDPPRCATCPLFDPFSDYENDEVGRCRLLPPQLLVAEKHSKRGTTVEPRSLWPVVRSTDWCGEHPEREENKK